jgi:signal transduction histidine kinase
LHTFQRTDVALADELLPLIDTGEGMSMMGKQDAERPARTGVVFKTVPRMASVIAIGIGVAVLVGWALDYELLKRIVPRFVAMNPLTATLFICSGASLALSIHEPSSRIKRVIAKTLAVIITLAAFCELLEAAGRWHSILDESLYASKLSNARDALPNRMAPNTSFNFFLAGASLLMLDARQKKSSLSQALAVVVGFGAILPITGYLYGETTFRGLASFIPMAIHTATTFLILAAGMFFAVPDGPLAQIFTNNDPRGVMARRLLPMAVLLTIFLGWLRVWGERQGLYESAFGTALFAITLSILFAILVRWTVGTVGKLEAERAAANVRLQELNRRKDEMIAVVSHDLCSPLTGFRMVIDLLRDGRENASGELLDLMDHSTRRMVSMVRGLLDVAKLESDKIELEREDVLVSDVIRQSMEPLTINANAKQITLELHTSAPEPVISADHLRLSQIFNNLLSNAVKFTSAGGRVTVTVDAADDGVRVVVKDTGLGITQTDLPHIFDKYYQASTKATNGEKGTGLGLAIVRELVLLHEGQINVKSEVNCGTAFTIYLPAKPHSSPQRNTPASGVFRAQGASSDRALDRAEQYG